MKNKTKIQAQVEVASRRSRKTSAAARKILSISIAAVRMLKIDAVMFFPHSFKKICITSIDYLAERKKERDSSVKQIFLKNMENKNIQHKVECFRGLVDFLFLLQLFDNAFHFFAGHFFFPRFQSF